MEPEDASVCVPGARALRRGDQMGDAAVSGEANHVDKAAAKIGRPTRERVDHSQLGPDKRRDEDYLALRHDRVADPAESGDRRRRKELLHDLSVDPDWNAELM